MKIVVSLMLMMMIVEFDDDVENGDDDEDDVWCGGIDDIVQWITSGVRHAYHVKFLIMIMVIMIVNEGDHDVGDDNVVTEIES